jgi:acyl carrier protein
MSLDNGTAAAIRDLLAEKLLVEVPSPDADLLEGGLLDSLALIQLLVHLEERFGLKISLDELEIEDLRSIGSIARMVDKHRTSQIPPAPQTSLTMDTQRV